MSILANDTPVLLELGLSSSATAEEQDIVSQAISAAEAAVKRYLHYDPEQKSHTEYYPVKEPSVHYGAYVWEAGTDEAYVRRLATAQTDILQLRHIPVRSSPALDVRIDYDGRFGTLSGSFDSDTQQTESEDYWPEYDGQDSSGNPVCRSGILKSIGRWPSEPGSVKVVYTAGYTASELAGTDSVIDAYPITEAVVQEAVRRAKRALAVWKKQSTAGHAAGPLASERLGDYSYSVQSGAVDYLVRTGGLSSAAKELLDPFVHYGVLL